MHLSVTCSQVSRQHIVVLCDWKLVFSDVPDVVL